MPTYQYACSSCGEDLEVVQKFTDDALTECPSCSGKLRKVYSPVGVVFKGSGFYRNDSRDAKKSGAANGSGNGNGKVKESSSSDSAASSSSSGDSSSSSSSSSDAAKPAASSSSSSSGKASNTAA